MEWLGSARMLLADAGIPLLGTSTWLVIAVSVFIGFLEAVLLQRWYTVRPIVVRWTGAGTAAAIGMAEEPEEWSMRSTFLVVAANVISSLLGLVLLTHDESYRQWILGVRPLEKLELYFISLWLLAFAVSAIIEWPFFSVAIKDRPLSREGLAVCLGTNIVSSSCILLCLATMGMTSPAARTVNVFSLARQPYAHIYYLDPVTRRVCEIDSSGLNAHLTNFILSSNQSISAETVGSFTKLVAFDESGKTTSLYNFGDHCSAAQVDVKERDVWARDARYFSDDDRRMYDVHYGPVPSDGLSVTKSNDIYKIAVDNGLVSWHWSHVTVLPNRQAIGQLGSQIVLVDLETGATAVLAQGECPTVVVDK